METKEGFEGLEVLSITIRSREMAMRWLLLDIFLITAFGILTQPSASDSSGFISIDCGIPAGTSNVDTSTGLTYVSDETYTDSGVNSKVNSQYSSLFPNMETKEYTLRFFPNSTRNCYTLKPAVQYHKYLLRATFTYGNYEGNYFKPLQFDLYLDVNLWVTVNITEEKTYLQEVVYMALVNNSVSVCLVNTGNGVPFISSLELRPLNNTMYPRANATQFLPLAYRDDLGSQYSPRYPTDPYDRSWMGWTDSSWDNISTDNPIDLSSIDDLRPPTAVMQTAVVTASVRNKLKFSLNFTATGVPHNLLYAYFYFAELVALGRNQSRSFDILLNGDTLRANYSPSYLVADSHEYILPTIEIYVWNFVADATSTLPPTLNAMEVYSVMYVLNQPTKAADVDAITAIKDEYKVKKYWSGDPCSPKEYVWDGLNCSYDPQPPTIIAVNLSSSGLTGGVSPSFGKLAAIKYLDLSYNNLTGTVPDTLGDLSSLQLLNLCGNNISQDLPSSLTKRKNNGLQIIFNCSDPVPCLDCDKKKSKLHILIPSVVAGLVVLLTASVFVIWSVRRRRQGPALDIPNEPHKKDYSSHFRDHPPDNNEDQHSSLIKEHLLEVDSRKFTRMQLAKITNNYARELGKGGYGHVYHGYVEPGTEVAVKVHSQSSSQGAKEFLAEAQNLTRASHRNLVKLIGYCIDDKYLALVYEYLPQGSLQEHLKGTAGRVLSWQERIKIAAGAAQALEYLHKWCSPPIIHRDIKSSNILLDHNLEAKLADFGLSKAFSYDETHVSTNVVVGTTGYVDPEYHNTFQLTEKSDVFSFGVVLLELLTGQPPLVPHSGKPHLIRVVSSVLVDGSIDEIVDQRLEGDFDANSAWKIVELAKLCTAQTGAERPTMTEVVIGLRDCLELEATRLKMSSENQYIDEFNMTPGVAFEVGPTAR